MWLWSWAGRAWSGFILHLPGLCPTLAMTIFQRALYTATFRTALPVSLSDFLTWGQWGKNTTVNWKPVNKGKTISLSPCNLSLPAIFIHETSQNVSRRLLATYSTCFDYVTPIWPSPKPFLVFMAHYKDGWVSVWLQCELPSFHLITGEDLSIFLRKITEENLSCQANLKGNGSYMRQKLNFHQGRKLFCVWLPVHWLCVWLPVHWQYFSTTDPHLSSNTTSLCGASRYRLKAIESHCQHHSMDASIYPFTDSLHHFQCGVNISL